MVEWQNAHLIDDDVSNVVHGSTRATLTTRFKHTQCDTIGAERKSGRLRSMAFETNSIANQRRGRANCVRCFAQFLRDALSESNCRNSPRFSDENLARNALRELILKDKRGQLGTLSTEVEENRESSVKSWQNLAWLTSLFRR